MTMEILRASRPWRRAKGQPGVAGAFTAAVLVALLLGGLSPGAQAQDEATDAAAALNARRIALQPQLRASAFGEPLYLVSRDGSDQIEGETLAEVRQPFAAITASLKSGRAVCELLFLHLNVRGCRSVASNGGETLALTVGPKRAQESGVRYYLDYAMRVEVATPAYLRMTLKAAQGPLATRDYRIVVEVVPMDANRSFVRLAYAYRTGALARIAMGAYLATAGRAKIGFTVIGQDDAGRPVFVDGERAALERNVIRYFLALVASSSVKEGAPRERMEAKLRTWFALTERYAAQLHELKLDEYLHEKHDDLAADAVNPP